MKKLALRLLVAVLTLSAGVGVALYLKQRAHAKKCAESTYFAPSAFGDNRKAELLGKYYAALREPTFSCLDEDIEVYRLLYLPAFESPTAIRVWREEGKYWMTIKQLDAGWLPGLDRQSLKLNTTRQLSVNEWVQFKNLLNRANFWSMPAADGREPGLDGISFTLEGKIPGRNHVVYRWMPEDESFVEACHYLVSITNLTWRQGTE